MRYLVSLLFISSLLIGSNSYSQDLPVDPKSKLVTYSEVVTESGSKKEFFNRAVSWMNLYYTNPFAITTERKKDEGVIAAKHEFRIFTYTKDSVRVIAGTILYKFKLEFKEGRYRYTMYDFVMRKKTRFPIEGWLDDENPQKGENWPSFIEQINTFAESWVESLKEGMKPEKAEEEEEW